MKKIEESDLLGKKFGKLKIDSVYIRNKRSWCRVSCDCGNKKEIPLSSLKSGLTKSCGCIRKQRNNGSKYYYNEDFFDKRTEESSYILGLLYTDGHLDKTGNRFTISLQESDKNILEKIGILIRNSPDVKYFERISKTGSLLKGYYILFTNKNLYQSLIKYGLYNNKTDTISPSPLLKNDRDFWRGCIDGDGGISIQNGKYLTISFGGSEFMVDGFIEFMKKNGIDFKSNYRYIKNKYHRIYITGENARSLYSLLYKDSKISISRKMYNKLLEVNKMRIKRYSEIEPVNEEILGKIVNFFKNMWNKAIEELEKLGNDPNDVKDYILKNTLNTKDDTNVFSKLLTDFGKLPGANDQACLDLVSNMLDQESGSLGKQGIGVMFSDKKLQGEDMKAKRRMMEFVINSARDKTIADIKFQVDPKKRNPDNLDDVNHLPDLKKALKAATDESKKKEATLNFVNTKLIPGLINNVKAVREEDIKKTLEKEGIELPADFEVKDIVKYKTKKYDPNKDEDDQPEGGVAQGEVRKIDGENITIFNSKLNAEIKKTKTDIIGKAESGEEQKGENAKKAAEQLGKIKGDEDKMGQVAKFAEFIQNDANKDKIAEIQKILGGE